MAVKNLSSTERLDFTSRFGSLDLYRDVPSRSSGIPVPLGPPRPLTPIDLNAEEAREVKLETSTDICKVCHIQHERPVVFHELIPDDSNSSSDAEDRNVDHRLPVVEENSDLDSMPELEDEINLDNIEIPLWLIPRGVVITFCGG